MKMSVKLRISFIWKTKYAYTLELWSLSVCI